ncbi:hypothetical protein [Umezawaea tangerina]|nr:hypothetical protein [Umezawaea tangerina]
MNAADTHCKPAVLAPVPARTAPNTPFTAEKGRYDTNIAAHANTGVVH